MNEFQIVYSKVLIAVTNKMPEKASLYLYSKKTSRSKINPLPEVGTHGIKKTIIQIRTHLQSGGNLSPYWEAVKKEMNRKGELSLKGSQTALALIFFMDEEIMKYCLRQSRLLLRVYGLWLRWVKVTQPHQIETLTKKSFEPELPYFYPVPLVSRATAIKMGYEELTYPYPEWLDEKAWRAWANGVLNWGLVKMELRDKTHYGRMEILKREVTRANSEVTSETCYNYFNVTEEVDHES